MAGHSRPVIDINQAVILVHQVPGPEALDAVVETCAGMSIMSQGPSSCGAEVKVSNELRQMFCDVMKATGHKGVVCGDIREHSVVAEMHELWPTSSIMMAGFSRQPWSRLGDHKGFADQRSTTLPATLKAAYMLRCHTLILECVTNAGADKDVMDTIKHFMQMTGYRMGSATLKLENIMPANRHRWRCVLTSPFLPPISLRDLPLRANRATIGDVLPTIPFWPTEQTEQLELDRYETNKIWQSGTFEKCIMMDHTTLPTALHGWANQLGGCPCGCRKGPMSDERLMSKGIFTSLILVGGVYETKTHQLPKTRHVHSWEFSTLHGVIFDEDWPKYMRLLVSGLGQMATPIQSAWVFGQYKSQLQAFWGAEVKKPEHYLWDHFQRFFASVVHSQPSVGMHPKFQNFIQDTKALLQSSMWATNAPILGVHMPALPEFTSPVHPHPTENVQRASVEYASVGPRVQVEEGEGRISLRAEISDQPVNDQTWDTNNHQPCAKSQHDTPSGAQEGHDDDQETPCVRGWSIEAPPQEGLPTAMQSRAELNILTTPVIQRTTTGLDHASLNRNNLPKETREDTDEPFEPPTPLITVAGGIAAFATGVNLPEAPQPPFLQEEDGGDGFTQELEDFFANEDTKQPEENSGANTEERTTQSNHSVQVIHRGEPTPITVMTHVTTTVGMLTVADENMKVMEQPIKATNSVGVLIPASEVTFPGQQIFLEHFDGEHAANQQGLRPSALTNAHKVTRISVLYEQKAWVAKDEMGFYLAILQESGFTAVVDPLVLPNTEVVETLAERWGGHIRQKYPDGTREHTISTCILWRQHWSPVMMVATQKGLMVYTIPYVAHIVEAGLVVVGIKAEVVTAAMQNSFPNDCGFQSIHWLAEQCEAPSDRLFQPPIPALPTKSAVTMRNAFELYLHKNNLAHALVRPSTIEFGGATDEVVTGLMPMLTEHGVPDSAVEERAKMIEEKLGRVAVAKALRGKFPWKDIKSLANNQLPKIQLVLPGEFADAIASRLKQPRPFGSKATKNKRPEKPQKSPIVLQAEDISVPPGVFKDASGVPLTQINPREIGPQAQGIVIMDPAEAITYAKIGNPVSKAGLAIIVVNHQDPTMTHVGQQIRLPAKCERTGEPILMTAKIIQIGKIEVLRAAPDKSVRVDEVKATVLRTILYRDECDTDWAEIIKGPARYIIKQVTEFEPNHAGKSPIIYAWDRQYLSENMENANHTKQLR